MFQAADDLVVRDDTQVELVVFLDVICEMRFDTRVSSQEQRENIRVNQYRFHARLLEKAASRRCATSLMSSLNNSSGISCHAPTKCFIKLSKLSAIYWTLT